MKEYIIQTELSDLKISVFLLKEGFHLWQHKEYKDPVEKAFALHHHSTYEIFFAMGSIDLMTAEASHHYESTILVVPPNCAHYSATFHNCYGINFTFEPLSPKKQEVYIALKKALTHGLVALPMEETERFYFGQLVKAMAGELPREQASHLIPLLFSQFFSRLIPRARGEINESKRHRYINLIDSYIARAFAGRPSLSDLAEHLHLCPRQVSRILQKEYNCSFSQLVHKQRLDTACYLLKQTNLPISEIAAGVGYEFENYFFSQFKKEYGVTPTEYRKKNDAAHLQKL